MGKRKRKSEEWRAKREEEQRFLHDLSAFPNLRELYKSEAILSERRKKKHNHSSNNHNNQADLRVEIGVNNAVEVKTTEALASGNHIDSALVIDVPSSPEDDVVHNNDMVEIVPKENFPGKSDVNTGNVDNTVENENVVEMSKTLALNDGFKTSEIIDLSFTSSEGEENVKNSRQLSLFEDDGDIKNRSLDRSETQLLPGEQLGPNETRMKSRNRKRRMKRNVCADLLKLAYGNEKQACGNKINGAGVSEMKSNTLLRRFLRTPRYFDFPNYWDTCFSCGEEDNTIEPCEILKQKQNKPCLYCGSYMHTWRSCRQDQFCDACKNFGHVVECCPEKHQERSSIPVVCLRCGNPGHDMMSCNSEYSPDDLKKMQCYVCKNFGHLCCRNFPDTGSSEPSCYKCGFPGHLGSDCSTGIVQAMVENPYGTSNHSCVEK